MKLSEFYRVGMFNIRVRYNEKYSLLYLEFVPASDYGSKNDADINPEFPPIVSIMKIEYTEEVDCPKAFEEHVHDMYKDLNDQVHRKIRVHREINAIYKAIGIIDPPQTQGGEHVPVDQINLRLINDQGVKRAFVPSSLQVFYDKIEQLEEVLGVSIELIKNSCGAGTYETVEDYDDKRREIDKKRKFNCHEYGYSCKVKLFKTK